MYIFFWDYSVPIIQNVEHEDYTLEDGGIIANNTPTLAWSSIRKHLVALMSAINRTVNGRAKRQFYQEARREAIIFMELSKKTNSWPYSKEWRWMEMMEIILYSKKCIKKDGDQQHEW